MSNGSPNPPPFNVTVICQGGTTTPNPPKLPVPWSGTGKQITINWNAQGGAQFPSSGAFSWKSGSATPGSLPTRISNTQLQLVYTAPASTVTYSYNIKLNNCNQADPDIENETPPGDEDDDDQGKKRHGSQQ